MTITRNVPKRSATGVAWNAHLRTEFLRLWGDAQRMRIRNCGISDTLETGEQIAHSTLVAWRKRGWVERGRCIDERTAIYLRTEDAP